MTMEELDNVFELILIVDVKNVVNKDDTAHLEIWSIVNAGIAVPNLLRL